MLSFVVCLQTFPELGIESLCKIFHFPNKFLVMGGALKCICHGHHGLIVEISHFTNLSAKQLVLFHPRKIPSWPLPPAALQNWIVLHSTGSGVGFAGRLN